MDVYTNCVDGKFDRLYEMVEPITCDPREFDLPEPALGLDCTDCNPGFFH
jgi:hypothetical protein